jgi:hypothetical protein
MTQLRAAGGCRQFGMERHLDDGVPHPTDCADTQADGERRRRGLYRAAQTNGTDTLKWIVSIAFGSCTSPATS